MYNQTAISVHRHNHIQHVEHKFSDIEGFWYIGGWCANYQTIPKICQDACKLQKYSKIRIYYQNVPK